MLGRLKESAEHAYYAAERWSAKIGRCRYYAKFNNMTDGKGEFAVFTNELEHYVLKY